MYCEHGRKTHNCRYCKTEEREAHPTTVIAIRKETHFDLSNPLLTPEQFSEEMEKHGIKASHAEIRHAPDGMDSMSALLSDALGKRVGHHGTRASLRKFVAYETETALDKIKIKGVTHGVMDKSYNIDFTFMGDAETLRVSEMAIHEWFNSRRPKKQLTHHKDAEEVRRLMEELMHQPMSMAQMEGHLCDYIQERTNLKHIHIKKVCSYETNNGASFIKVLFNDRRGINISTHTLGLFLLNRVGPKPVNDSIERVNEAVRVAGETMVKAFGRCGEGKTNYAENDLYDPDCLRKLEHRVAENLGVACHDAKAGEDLKIHGCISGRLPLSEVHIAEKAIVNISQNCTIKLNGVELRVRREGDTFILTDAQYKEVFKC